MAAASAAPMLVLAAPPGEGSFPAAGGGGSALQESDRSWLHGQLPRGRFIVLDGRLCLHRDQSERWVADTHAFAATTAA